MLGFNVVKGKERVQDPEMLCGGCDEGSLSKSFPHELLRMP
jgi:hypothetical protein